MRECENSCNRPTKNLSSRSGVAWSKRKFRMRSFTDNFAWLVRGGRPRFLLLCAVFLPPHAQQQDHTTDTNTRIGNVEYREGTHRNEIGHVPNGESIDQVADRPSQLHAHRQPQRPICFGNLRIIINNGSTDDESQDREDHAASLKYAKRRATVVPMNDPGVWTEPQERIRKPTLARRDMCTHQPLRPLIQSENHRCNCKYAPII